MQKQRSKASHVRDEVSDIVVGDDLVRALPSELARLTNPLTKSLFFRDYIEKNLLCYELKGQEEQGRGPIVVCIDNSGSMSGEKEVWSKAVSLALLDIARKQHRAFAIVHFDTKVHYKFLCQKNQEPDWTEVMKAMEFFSGGGTNFQPALEVALNIIGQDLFKKADVILVTDGDASDDWSETYKRRAKEKDVTTYGIQIGPDIDNALKAYCDKQFAVSELDTDSPAIDAIFTI